MFQVLQEILGRVWHQEPAIFFLCLEPKNSRTFKNLSNFVKFKDLSRVLKSYFENQGLSRVSRVRRNPVTIWEPYSQDGHAHYKHVTDEWTTY